MPTVGAPADALYLGCAWPAGTDGCPTPPAYQVVDAAGDGYRVCDDHLPRIVRRLAQAAKPITVERLRASS
jgi:hypothetical protein